MMFDRDLLIWYHENNVSQSTLEQVLCDYGSITAFLGAADRGKRPYAKHFKVEPNDSEVGLLMEQLEESGMTVSLRDEEDYPQVLANIPDAPLLLYAKGTYDPVDQLAVGVVGSRKCTPYGAWACEKLVREMAAYDVTIISGLALGIDRIAHETALQHGTRTIGVLGNGLKTVYPSSHRALYREVEQNGCILSEFPSWAQPLPHHFPFRNRIIAGLSIGLLVIEAKEKSGTMSTAAHALSQGKDVFAVPGNLNSLYSVGCNRLIQDGASLVTSADDILEAIAMLSLRKKKQEKATYDLSEDETLMIEILKERPFSVDELVERTKLPVHEMHTLVTLLEMRGLLEVRSGLCFYTG